VFECAIGIWNAFKCSEMIFLWRNLGSG